MIEEFATVTTEQTERGPMTVVEVTLGAVPTETDPPACVWMGTEGMENGQLPLICTETLSTGMQLLDALGRRQIITEGALIPCCRGVDGDALACARDIFYEEEVDTITTVLRTTAERVGIDWPEDIANEFVE